MGVIPAQAGIHNKIIRGLKPALPYQLAPCTAGGFSQFPLMASALLSIIPGDEKVVRVFSQTCETIAEVAEKNL